MTEFKSIDYLIVLFSLLINFIMSLQNWQYTSLIINILISIKHYFSKSICSMFVAFFNITFIVQAHFLWGWPENDYIKVCSINFKD
jgi:hypothetical protein